MNTRTLNFTGGRKRAQRAEALARREVSGQGFRGQEDKGRLSYSAPIASPTLTFDR